MNSAARSLLFTPGSRSERFLEAAGTEADALIFDLEDAVAEGEKAAARGNVVAFLSDRPQIHQQIIVRINPIALTTCAWNVPMRAASDFTARPRSIRRNSQ